MAVIAQRGSTKILKKKKKKGPDAGQYFHVHPTTMFHSVQKPVTTIISKN